MGSSYDNALAESVIGLYKTELIKPRKPWKGLDDLEIATPNGPWQGPPGMRGCGEVPHIRAGPSSRERRKR